VQVHAIEGSAALQAGIREAQRRPNGDAVGSGPESQAFPQVRAAEPGLVEQALR
jgi:hypothetical protein